MKQSTKILLLIIAILCVILAIQTCNTNPPTSPIETKQLKQSIATNKVKAAKLKPIIIIKDSIRTKYVTKWKEVRHDSLIPCPEKLAIADTVIYRDSSLISSLKLLCKIDSSIIADQSKVIVADSVTIVGLKKDNKKLRRHNMFWKALSGIESVVIGTSNLYRQ